MDSQLGVRALDHKQIREGIRHEVDNINAEFLSLACDEEIGGRVLRILGADQSIQTMLASASPDGLRTATYCGAPLIKPTESAEMLFGHEPRKWPQPKGPAIPRPLQELVLYTLECARVLALRDQTIAATFFQMSLQHAQRMSRMSFADIRAMSRRRDPLLRLRAADKPMVWRRLLIGDVLPYQHALTIAEMAGTAMISGE